MTGLLYLSWNNHSSSFGKKLISLHQKNLYCDCTIVCEDKFYPAHKFVLSTCSEYFEEIFEKAVAACEYPFVVLKDISPTYLELLFSYMYSGGVSITYDKLSGLVVAAESLKIKGLAVPDGSDESETKSYFSNLDRKRHISSPEGNSTNKKVKCSESDNASKLMSKLCPSEANFTPIVKVPQRKLCSIPTSPKITNKAGPEQSSSKSLRALSSESSSSVFKNEITSKLTSSGFTNKLSFNVKNNNSQNTLINNLSPESFQNDPSCDTTLCNLPKPISLDHESTSCEQTSGNKFDLEGIKVKVETLEPQAKNDLKVRPTVEFENSDGKDIDNFSSTRPLQDDHHFYTTDLPQLSTWNNGVEKNENFGWPFSRETKHEIQFKEEPIGNYVSFFKTDDLSETYVSEKLNYSHNIQLGSALKRRRKVAKRRGRCRFSSHSYKCSLCNSSFASKSNVRFHVATVHEKVTSYPCPRCDSAFSQKGNFKTHFNTVHLNIRPFECSVCEAVFSQKGNLKSHYSKKHNIELTDLESLSLKDDYSANISNINIRPT